MGKHESNVAAFNMIDGLLGCLNLLFVCLLICLMLVLTMVLRSQLNCAWICCDATTWKTPWGGGGKAEGWRDSTINNETNKAYSGKWPLSKDSISRLINKWETRWDSKDDLQTKKQKTKKIEKRPAIVEAYSQGMPSRSLWISTYAKTNLDPICSCICL